ncbi:MAG: hypothetical protein B7Z81_07780, partial [Acidocella sp. 20-61-6]
ASAAALMLSAPLANAAIVPGVGSVHAQPAAYEVHRADYQVSQQRAPQVNNNSHQYNYHVNP